MYEQQKKWMNGPLKNELTTEKKMNEITSEKNEWITEKN